MQPTYKDLRVWNLAHELHLANVADAIQIAQQRKSYPTKVKYLNQAIELTREQIDNTLYHDPLSVDIPIAESLIRQLQGLVKFCLQRQAKKVN